jgi:hypothetical protein
MTLEQLFAANRIELKDPKPGENATTCPECSAQRSAKHRETKCLSVRIDDDKAFWHCHHCGWFGPRKGNAAGRERRPDHVYRDVDGVIRFGKFRNPPGANMRFYLGRPNGAGGWIAGTTDETTGTKVDTSILYRIDEVAEAVAAGRVIAVVEGEKDADNLWRIGFAATCNAHGASEPDKAPKWTKKHSAQLRGADIVVLNDNDPPGYAHAEATCRLSVGVAKRVRCLDLKDHWPTIPKGGDVSDWLAAGHDGEELAALIAAAPEYAPPADPQPKPQPAFEPLALTDTLAVFNRWLKLKDDTPILATLGAVAANLIDGDPVWLGIVAPPSSAKTEILNSISLLLFVVPAATLSPAALLSGTPRKDRDASATGGLLRVIGEFGVLSLKDFGSILSMRQDAKAELLAALREEPVRSGTQAPGRRHQAHARRTGRGGGASVRRPPLRPAGDQRCGSRAHQQSRRTGGPAARTGRTRPAKPRDRERLRRRGNPSHRTRARTPAGGTRFARCRARTGA